METLLERVEQYFNNTSNEQFLKDWEAALTVSSVNAPTVESYLEYSISLPPENIIIKNFESNIENPNFTSDFFIPKKYEKRIFWT